MARSRVFAKKIEYWLTTNRRKKQGRFRFSRTRLLSILATLFLFFLFFGTLSAFGVVGFLSKDLPAPDRLTQREIPQSTKVYSRQGDLLYEIFTDERRTLIDFADIPDDLLHATLAVEDAEFYQHQGFDIKGIARAAVNILRGEGLQGGSTITQQLVKNTLLTPERTVSRKVKDVILAIEIERKYSKDEILQMYLNEAPYGGQAWGVGAAAEMYFGKHVRDLTLTEAAFLAGLPQSPTRYSPFGPSPENAAGRQSYVLYLMETKGWTGEDGQKHYISQEGAEAARQEFNKLKFKPPGQNIIAPHFVMYVKQRLTEQYGDRMVEQGGLRVYTTLDTRLQRIAEEEVEKQLAHLEEARAKASNATLVAVNPKTGEILAMVGSRNYFDEEHDGNVNGSLAARQPGSAIKPIMYVTAFKQGYTPATFLSDIRTCWKSPGQDYCPEESDGKYWGPMLLRDALANSRNVPAVKMLEMVGINNVIDGAHELGITTLNEPERYGLSLTLGGGEVKPIDMAQAFSAFANGGFRNELVPVLRVEDASGKIIQKFEADKVKGRRVLEERYAYLITNILSDNEGRKRLFGARNLLEIDRPAGVKTGTTNDNRDAWTIGYTPSLVAAIWVGNFDNSPMAPTIQGSTGATPIWHYFMKRALEGSQAEVWEMPKDEFVKVRVDTLSGKLPQPGKEYPSREEIFIEGTEPTQPDNFHTDADVCKSHGLLATDWHRENNQAETRTYLYLREINLAWQSYTDEWMNKQGGYGKPPEEKCPIEIGGNVQEAPIVEIEEPADQQEMTAGRFEVKTKIYTAYTLTKVEFWWDDEKKAEVTSKPYEATYEVGEGAAGLHVVKVRAFDSRGNLGEKAVTLRYPGSPTPTSEAKDH